MRYELTTGEIEAYRSNGFVVIDDFLDDGEVDEWREAVGNAVAERHGRKFANQDVLIGDDDGINPDAEYYGKVFDQLLNLWQTNAAMKERLLDPRIGEMAARLAGVDGLRVWHDQALIKQPWANPTGFHLDTPFWSFSDRRAISIWIALDDATAENGCLYFFAGSHLATTFENPGITKNLDAIFEMYPSFRDRTPYQAAMKAGSCSFHNGMTIHGAGANMTNRSRRAMTCAFMPDGAVFNGQQNILTDEQMSRLRIGDLLADDEQNPLVYSATGVRPSSGNLGGQRVGVRLTGRPEGGMRRRTPSRGTGPYPARRQPQLPLPEPATVRRAASAPPAYETGGSPRT